MLRYQAKIMELQAYNFEKWDFKNVSCCYFKDSAIIYRDGRQHYIQREPTLLYSSWQLKVFLKCGHWVRWWMKLYLKPANKAEGNGKQFYINTTQKIILDKFV